VGPDRKIIRACRKRTIGISVLLLFGCALADSNFVVHLEMDLSNVHHFQFKRGFGKKQQLLALEGMEILWKHKNEFRSCQENLIWAPYKAGQYSYDNLKNVVDQLKALDLRGGNRNDFLELL